jgi:hypothetical protein
MFLPRALIVTQGEVADYLYIIQSGQAVVLADPDFVPGSGTKACTDPAKCVQVFNQLCLNSTHRGGTTLQ